MSGIEIVLIIGAGIIITKKVKEHRREKKLKELAAAGLLPEQHAPARLVEQQRNATTAEEEGLPLYSPPSKEYFNGNLPSYDDVRKEGGDPFSDSQTTETTAQAAASESQVTDPTSHKKSSKKWKLWARDKSANGRAE